MLLAGACALLTTPAATADVHFTGGEVVQVTGIRVGSPVLSTYSSCQGWVGHGGVPVIPMWVSGFFSPPSQVVGPYATSRWSGGFGSFDDHFPDGSQYQTFYVPLQTGDLGGYYGPGYYNVSGTVQDVGLSGGLDSRTIEAYIGPPSPYTTVLKCEPVRKITVGFMLGLVAGSALNALSSLSPEAGAAVNIYSTLGTIDGYAATLQGLLFQSQVEDPPDADYQQIAQPIPAPVLPADPDLSSDQQAAVIQLETALAGDIGLARAALTTINRVWGADNVPDPYWHRKQLAAYADYIDQLAGSLQQIPALFDDLKKSLLPDLPDELSTITVTPKDIGHAVAKLVKDGFSPQQAKVLDELGVSPQAQQQIVDAIVQSYFPDRLQPYTGADALFAQDYADLGTALHHEADGTGKDATAKPPVVADVTPKKLDPAGFTEVHITGTNLQSVTGVNFGPSAPGKAQATNLDCEPTECDVLAPAGTGSVDVIAIGPGGPSQPVAGSRVSYIAPTQPEISGVYPNTGPTSGGTSVQIRGTGLSQSKVYFGPTLADTWECSDTLCTATAPKSASARTVDITVVNPAGSSTHSETDQFTYSTTAPPTPGAPVVTGVSPAHGSDLGGQRITITGDNFTDATSVDFGTDTFAPSVEDPVVNDDSHLTLTTPPGTSGTVDLIVHGPGGASTPVAADKYTYDEPTAPVITSVSPSSGPDIGGTTVTVTGTNLTNGDLEIGDQYVYTADYTSPCTPTKCVFVTPPEKDGTRHITVSTDDGESATTDADQFTYTPGPAPVVTDVEPDTGPQVIDPNPYDPTGGNVVIFGKFLNGGTVTIGGKPAKPVGLDSTRCSMTACVVTAPPGDTPGPADVVVTTNAGVSAPNPDAQYTYVNEPPPTVTSVSPDSGFLSDFETVKVSGHDLAGGMVYFGDQQASSSRDDCTQSMCTVSAPPATDAGPVDVTVETASGTSPRTDTDVFTYYRPTITKVTPASGWVDGGTEVTVTGEHLAGGQVSFVGPDGESFGDGECRETTCTVTTEAHAEPETTDVVVSSPSADESAKTAADHFTFTAHPEPAVTGISPDHGTIAGGDQVTITGTGLTDGTVSFGDRQVDATCTATQCTATSPIHDAGAVDITVTTAGGTSPTSQADLFTYAAPVTPTITQVSPTHGSASGGTTVTITGTNLTNANIKFGGSPAADSSCTATSCTATTPPGTVGATVDITADTTSSAGGGLSATGAADKFTYDKPPAPTITKVDPDTSPASGGAVVTLTGTDLTGATVEFGDQTATSPGCDPTQCVVFAPPGAAGKVHVRATTVGGTSAATDGDSFNYLPLTIGQVDLGLTGKSGGGAVTRGIGGDMWFTAPDQDQVGRVDSDGAVTTYKLTDKADPKGITEGPDGRMWLTEETPNAVVAIDGSGHMTTYDVPGLPGDIRMITAGPDGRLWFSLLNSGAIGAITTDGTITLYRLPDASVGPFSIVTGPDGRLWFTEAYGDAVGAITTDGKVSEYPLPDADASSRLITNGPDGRLWLTEQAARQIAAVTTDGVVTDYPLAGFHPLPQGIRLGPDGRVWFADPDVDKLSALDPATGKVTDYPLPLDAVGVNPRYLAMAPDGSLWITEVAGSGLLHVTGIDTTGRPTVTQLSPDSSAAGDKIHLTGANLGAASKVLFGSTQADFTVTDPAHLAVTVPSGASGDVDVTVVTPNGTSATGPADRFGYGAPPTKQPTLTSITPAQGSTQGGEQVELHGAGLTGAQIAFGATPATDVHCTASACSATAPAADQAGSVSVTATTPGGTASIDYVYLAGPPPAPTVTAVSPDSGPVGGGKQVTVTGTNLEGGVVTFGLDQATDVDCSATSCTATAPPGGPGVVDVRVHTAGGDSARSDADHFQYGVATTTTLTPAQSTVTASYQPGNVTLTAVVGPADATGTVRFYRDGDLIGGDGDPAEAPVTVHDGKATVADSVEVAGKYSYTAVYSGDSTHAASASDPVVVTALEYTNTSLNVPYQPAVGQPATLTAYIDPTDATGYVTFTDSGTVLGKAPVNDDGTATFTTSSLSAGTHVVVATYSGDATYGSSSSTPGTFTVGSGTPGQTQSSTTSVSVAPTSPAYGEPATFTAAVSPTAATGQVEFIDGSDYLGTVALSAGTAKLTTSTLAPGDHDVYAVYLGDATYRGSTGDVTLTVSGTAPPSKTATTTTLAAPASAPAGQDVTLHASVTPQTATGTVTFKDGTATLGDSSLSDGTASLSVMLAVGTHHLTAVYSGDASDKPSTSAATTVTVTAVPSAPGAPTNVHATAGDGSATVTFDAPASDGGSAITGYTITPDPSCPDCTGLHPTGTSSTVRGLTNGTAYTFTVVATNAAGSSPASAPSAAVTPHSAGGTVTTPGAPTNVRAAHADDPSQVELSWSAPASDGGAAIDGYTVTASPSCGGCGGLSTTGATHTTITGLTPGVSYSFTVTAENAQGSGAASASSAAIIPTATPESPKSATTHDGNTPASVMADGVTATASGGTGTVTVAGYSDDPAAATDESPAGAYFDVSLSPGSSFTRVVVNDCNLHGGTALEWWNPAGGSGAGGWQPVTGDPTDAGGLPQCLKVTLDTTSSPTTAQLTGTIFAVVSPQQSPPPSGGGTGGGGAGGGGTGGGGTGGGGTGGGGTTPPPSTQAVTRVAGPTRYDTAAALALAEYQSGLSRVYVASGRAFPDALASGVPAALGDAPVLLVKPGAVPAAVRDALRKLDPKAITIVGGTVAVHKSVAGVLEKLTSGHVTRLAGPNRYATAAVVAEAAFRNGAKTAYLASGEAFPDALSAAPVAAAAHAPILLTRSGGLPAVTAKALRTLGVSHVVVVGGPAAVSKAVAHALSTIAEVTRVAGPDRYATSAQLSAGFAASHPARAYLASGQAFPDALAGAAVAGEKDVPILLTRATALPTAIATVIGNLGVAHVVILGGTAAVATSVADGVAELL